VFNPVCAIKALFGPVLLPLILSALLLLVLVPRWSVALAWLLCLVALIRNGRHGPTRPVAGVCAFGKSVTRRSPRAREVQKRAFGNGLATLSALCSLRWKRLFAHANGNWCPSNGHIKSRVIFMAFPPAYRQLGGRTFHSELAFPVLANDPNSRKYQVVWLERIHSCPFLSG